MSHGHHDEHDHHDEHNHHDDHGHNEHDDHDAHGHDVHDDHGHNEHDDHDEHDLHGNEEEHDEHGHDDEDENEEEKEFVKMIDISPVLLSELEDVDLGEIFILSELKPYSDIYKDYIFDLKKDGLKEINLTLKPKIKLISLKRPITDLKEIDKKSKVETKTLNVNNNKNFPQKNTLNLIDIENSNYSNGPFVDIIPPKKTIKKHFSESLKNIGKKIKKINFSLSSNKLDYSKLKPNFQVLSSYKKIDLTQIKQVKFSKYLSYFALFLLFIFLYGFYTKYKIETTLQNIKKLELTTNIKALEKDLIDIKSDLIISNILLKPIYLVNVFVGNDTISNAKFAISGVKNLINYSINCLVIYNGIHNLIEEKGPTDVMYGELIKNVSPILFEAKQNINASYSDLSNIKDLGDKNLNNLFSQKINLVKQINTYTNVFYKNIGVFSSMLGDEKKRTYAVIFQNQDEIRPTGGFMGSMGFIEIYKGKVIKFEKKDIYALEWGIKDTFSGPPPEGMENITKIFALRDANYYPDIGKSSQKIKYFLDKTDYKIDGIIYINQNVILDFLKNFGGIYFDKVKRDITSENFSMIMSTLVEAKISRTHTLATPKQILFDFIDVYFKELKKAGKYSLYIKSIFDSIEKQDIIFYSFNKDENKFLYDLGLIKDNNYTEKLDFNYPVFTSISGNKSDRYIERSFEKNIVKNNDCSIDTTLKLTQKHTFNISEEINIKNFFYDMDLLGKVELDETLRIQGKALNKQYIRVLIPKDAVISKNKSYNIRELPDAKEISFYMETPILFPSDFKLKYTLLNKECKNYNYTFYKQPGIKEYKLNVINNGNLVIDSYLSHNFSN